MPSLRMQAYTAVPELVMDVASDSEQEPEAPLIPARMLNEFTYCPRLGVLMWVEDAWAPSHDTVEGTHHHRRVDVPGPDLPSPAPAEGALDESDVSGGAPVAHPGQPSPDAPFVTRSVWLSAESEQLTCKMDLVAATDDEAVPVDTKRGAVPNIPEGAWEPERVQLCAQGLVLRANGWRCTHGFIYYAASRRRVRIEFDDALVTRTRELVLAFREAAQKKELPAPLEDSPKCPRCSLVGICLPDETRLLAEMNAQLPLDPARPHRQLLTPAPDTAPLYVTTQGARIGVRHSEFVISAREASDSAVPSSKPEKDTEIGRARIGETSQIAVVGNVQLSTQAIGAAMREDIPVCFFSYGGWFNGIARGMTHKHVQLRIEQYRAADDTARSLAIARTIVRSKIRNQRTLVRRNAEADNELALREMARFAELATVAESPEVLLGLEGMAARHYFQSLPNMLKPEAGMGFDFATRNRRPPRDPVNALLSFAYSLLTKDAHVALEAVGFDPYLGFYHKPRYGRPALALDLIEEFRPLIGDSTVLTAINNGELSQSSFVLRADGCALTTTGRRAFVSTYERRMEQLIQHPLFGYKVSWRRVIEVQARLLARHVLGEIPRYVPIETR